MTKCGKSILPECEYFATNGCVSPFNCPYKVENESITTATSTPCNLYPPETDKDKEISRLQAENAELRARLDKAIELPSKDRVWYIAKDEEGQESYIIPKPTSSLTVEELKYEMDKKYFLTREAAEVRLEEIKEKAELREKLNNFVELPCQMRDAIYTVIKNCTRCKYYNVGWAECTAPATANFDCESTHRTCFTQDIVTDECKKHLCVAELKFNLRLLNAETGELKPQYFIDPEAAKAQLKEIQGGEK